MAKSNGSSSKGSFGLVLSALVAALAVGALAVYIKSSGADTVPEDQRRPEPAVSKPAEVKNDVPKNIDRTERDILAMRPHNENGRVTFESRTLAVPQGQDPVVFAVNTFLADSGLGNGAKLEKAEVTAGEASLYFTPEFVQGQGSTDEQTLIEGLRMVVGQFPDIQTIRLFADGKPVEESGHFEFESPLTVKRPSGGQIP